MRYEVRSVVCDYGVYEDNKLVLILNSRRNAEIIVKILEADLDKRSMSVKELEDDK